MKNLKILKQYAIERDLFCEIFKEIGNFLYDIYPYESYSFKLWNYEDEWYLLHKESGTIVNWYKHLGRTNTCNKKLSIEEYKAFVKMFKDEVVKEFGWNEC